MEQLMFTVCYGRRMAVLSDRSVAILPPAAKKGDKVAAFSGGNALYLLRQKEGALSLVGECYVEGWMDGALAVEGRYSFGTLQLV
jgi:hypothetical protein